MIKRTKIICTIGPASSSTKTLTAMIKGGMNVARLNMSHGTYASHRAMIKTIRAVSKKFGEPVALLADLQGPKIRLGVLPEKGVELKGTVVFTTATDSYTDGKIPVTHKAMHKDVKKGDRILIEDGIYEVKVTKVSGKDVTTKVVNGGVVTSHKGMNFPDTTLSVDPITAKDKADAKFAISQKVQWVAMSFVTRPEDVKRMRRLIGNKAQIIVKIEKHEALKKFDAILAVADAIMVARGDLGVETPAEDVPLRQKEMIAKCRAAGKPVVVATQMLDSMIRNPRPTRAEVSDVANAVIDHTDAVMLSGESATGKYPVEAVEMMQKIAVDTEASKFDDLAISSETMKRKEEIVAGMIAVLSRIKQIDAVISTPHLAGRLNQFRPEVPIYLACKTESEARAWNIRWAVRPFVTASPAALVKSLRTKKLLKKGMAVAIVTQAHKQDPEIELHEI